MSDKVMTPEDIDAFDPGNYRAWCYDEESNDFCLMCARHELLALEGHGKLIITHSGGYIDTTDGITCCECGAEIIPPMTPNED